MKFEHTEVWGFEHALRGMRNSFESWDKSDSFNCHEGMGDCGRCPFFIDGHQYSPNDCQKEDELDKKNDVFIIGENDLALIQKLIKAGEPHRKFLRQIFVAVDIIAPQYFMAELDTYKIGVVRNSTSMQHKGTSHRYTIDDFEVDDNVKEVLRIKEKQFDELFYPYETEEYRLYTCENGRKYKVYRNGKVYSCAHDLTDSEGRVRHFEEKEYTPSITNSGYFELQVGGRNGEKWLLHRLVAFVWLENKNNYNTVDHLDMNKGNNSIENLQWVTLEENIKREWDNSKGFDLQKAYKNWKISSKLLPPDKLRIVELYKNGKTQKELAEIFGIKQAQISVICREENSTSKNRELFEYCWYWEQLLENLNILRDKYLDTRDYVYFRMIRQLMPMSYLYKSTVTMSYENVLKMIRERRDHKLTEWSKSFIEWAESLPYAKELLFYDVTG